MQIDKIGGVPVPSVLNAKNHPAVSEEPVQPEDLPEAPETEQEHEQPGVLRLLQEGHFKGVADVRLRINFYEELQGIESQARVDAAAGGFAAFNQSLEADITALRESGELTQEQSAALDAFLTQVATLQNDYDGTTPFAEIIAGLQGQLDSLLASLNPPAPDAIAEPEPSQELPIDAQIAGPEASPEQPTAEEAPAEEPQQTDDLLLPDETEEPNVFQQLVTNLQNTFAQALEQLQSDVTTTSTLPPLSEPSGNGKAYAKFVAIYESMQNGTMAPAASEEEPAGESTIEA
jgi:hypothetical protein